MDIKRARDLFADLQDHMRAHYSDALYYPYRNAGQAVKHLDMDLPEEEKEQIVRDSYALLFPARGGLTDYVFWDPDHSTRKALNEVVLEAERELRDIINGSDGSGKKTSCRPPVEERAAEKERIPAKRKTAAALYYGICGAAFLGLFLFYRIYGVMGQFVPAGEICFGLACILPAAVLFPLFFSGKRQGHRKIAVPVLIVSLLLFGYGIRTEVRACLDLSEGPVIAVMSECSVMTRPGLHGILGPTYYVAGTDDQGKEHVFPVKSEVREQLEEHTDLIIEYYCRLKKIVRFDYRQSEP